MGVYEDLLAWSATRPAWQRDALRRLVVSGQLSDHDLEELTSLAMSRDGAAPTIATAPLHATDLPGTEPADTAVTLVAIADPRNLNALAPDARLDFAPQGLTIVYGGNGSGKSGYVRVLRRVCRARSAPPRILPNLVTEDDQPTSAVVEFAVDGDPRTRVWSETEAVADELGAIAVYDRACAAVYVREENEVAYRPLGLDVLDLLAKCLREIRRRLDLRRAACVLELRPPPGEIWTSPAIREIWPIRIGLTRAHLIELSHWTAADIARRAQIASALSAPSPRDAAAGLRARQGVLNRMLRTLREWDAAVGDAAVVVLEATLREKADAEEQLSRLRDDALSSEPLEGVGSGLWKAMWAAAGVYSSRVAYPASEFPTVDEGARCVLCGQTLEEESRNRFSLLRKLVESGLGAQVDTFRESISGSTLRLEQLANPAAGTPQINSPTRQASEDLILELRQFDDALGGDVFAASQSVHDRAAALLQRIEGGAHLALEAFALPAISARLSAAIADFQTQIDLLDSAGDPVGATDLRSEALELQGRQWLHENTDAVIREVERLDLVARLAEAIGTCDTQPVTLKSNELTDRYVTEKLEADFATEVDYLNRSRVRIVLRKRGEAGVTYHRLELERGGRANAKVDDVVSDGEFGAIALATFFAELAQGPTCSGIVLDDPVSSLDHNYRARVASRLAEEASHRQVIVFTHDLVFLGELQSCTEALGIDCTFRRLRATSTHVGWPEPEPPWLGMKIMQRIEVLKARLNPLKTVHGGDDPELYERDAREWYGRLRETWERAVEEVLLGDAVTRYRHDVKTRNLVSNKIWTLDEQDVRDVDVGMTKSSAWIRGHDQPMAVDEAVPEPAELAADLTALEDWVRRLKAKRQ